LIAPPDHVVARTDRHVTPAEMHIRQDAVEQREQRRRPDQRYEQLHSAPQQRDA
jgi:hypothetical protein